MSDPVPPPYDAAVLGDDEQTPKPSGRAARRKAEARPARGDVVTYAHRDPLSGDQLTGAGVVVEVAESGAVKVAPISVHVLEVDPENLAAVDFDAGA